MAAAAAFVPDILGPRNYKISLKKNHINCFNNNILTANIHAF